MLIDVRFEVPLTSTNVFSTSELASDISSRNMSNALEVRPVPGTCYNHIK